MSYRIVIVEDSPEMVESLTEVFRRELGEVEIVVSGFDNAVQRIADAMPDVVVLDIFDDQVEEHPEDGVKPAWHYVWKEHFCPVVFHSAHEVDEYRRLGHPFTRYEIKSPNSQRRVADHIKSFAPQIEGLRGVRRELSRHAGAILRHASGTIWQGDRTPAQQMDLFLRVARRRMSAALDHVAEHETQTQAWEQYIYPPIGDDLLTGDLIRARDANANEPTAYGLVLAPSCDLVRRRAKTLEHVLVAQCVSANDFLAKAGISAQKLNDHEHRKKLLSELSKDQVAGLTVLPPFPDVLPLMAANLKKLSLVPYANIATKSDEARAFLRVASVDSPFRERLAWAYLQVAGRPGVPDVDREALANSIAQTIAPAPT
jgi:CheY-like chemotaxis protein